MADWLPDLAAEFPNTIERRRQSSARPDTMSEHSTSGIKPFGNDASVDPDTCRICRGEGTPEEPLFYPCKCSGSIKYVHQDCLMEWLSHSQKKHCELCKTPFRFTKLYSPDMPKRLPFYIFVTHMARYLVRNILVWLRAILVISVWLGWLPYLMRSVWSFLFWLSDEGFGPGPPVIDSRNGTSIGRDDLSSFSITYTTTCASSPLFAATTTAASVGGVIEQIPVSTLLKSISKPLVTNPSSWLAMLLGLTPVIEKSSSGVKELLNVTAVDHVATLPPVSYPSSLLSDISILKNFTRHPAINRVIIAVLEGQIITLLVIVCFILIILVRDYVVQQQPEINMRAAFAAGENEAPPPPVGPMNNPMARNVDLEDDDDLDSDDDSIHLGGDLIMAYDEQEGANQGERARDMIGLHNPRPRPIAGFRRRATRPDADTGREDRGIITRTFTFDSEIAERDEEPEAGPSQHVFVDRSALDRFEGTTDVEDNDHASQSTVKEYLRIYREAGGDQEKILQIIRDEGLEDRMRYWIRVTQSMATAGKASDESSPDSGSGVRGSAVSQRERHPSSSPDRSRSPRPERTGSDTSSWTWAETDDGETAASQGSNNKGKNKATQASVTEADSWTSWGGEFGEANPYSPNNNDNTASGVPSSHVPALTRARAASDGPRSPKRINPLANNNWSFSDLPSSPHDVLHEGTSMLPGPTLAISAFNSTSATVDSHEDIDDIQLLEPRAFDRDEQHASQTESHLQMSLGMQLDSEDRLAAEYDLLGPAEDGPIENPINMIDQVHDAEPTVVVARQAGGIVDRVADFMWGDVEVGPHDDIEPEDAVDIFGDNQNAQFFDNDPVLGREEDEAEMAPDVVEAAVAAGLDPEAVEDAEDFEGIMELIGMRGPIAGLFQNAIFCAFLVSISIFLCIFIPYNVGRVSVWIMANPARLLRIVFSVSKFVQDAALLVVGYTSTLTFSLFEAFRLLFKIEHGKHLMHTLRIDTRRVALGALDRILASFMSEMPLISVSEMRNFSALSHEALLMVKSDIRYAFSSLGNLTLYVFGGDYLAKWAVVQSWISVFGPELLGFLKSIPGIAVQPGSWMLNLNLPESPLSANPGLAHWDANDRTWAILLGYVSLSILAGLYLARGTPFSSGQTAQEWEASIIDALNQASGVMKVILIISIEMLIFPLYCGLLLDFALLPLFEGTTVKSRLLFTYNYPLTSIFVHWFVGTGYMFHFALFVSMCRKIMRKGVLYFIRDPDDPEFHPVRDVLERNVTTQLRKILFSAFVYGALVVICLGGVVWGLSLALPNVLPIHYSSNEPVLEFPIDLLFYNFLMPLAVRFFKPSDGLHAMYTWWFRKCARGLRLTWFLFGERRVDEEGTLTLTRDSPYQNLPWWCTVFLEVSKEDEVAPKTWQDTFKGGKAKPSSKIPADEMILQDAKKKKLVESRQLIPDGRFVRSPASDQVKIPKGQTVFLDVSEQDIRQDGRLDRPDSDLYSGIHYQLVYIPPWFRLRIFLFILFIWIFAAVTGVGFTIVPLVFGRRMFNVLIPSHIRTNDIYAFSIGVYILGSLGYFVFHLQSMLSKLRAWTTSAADSMVDRHAIQRALQFTSYTCRLLYTYVVLLVVFPLLITLLVELYLLMPLHTYMYPAGIDTTRRLDGLREGHTIRVIQAWTLGILYLKLGSRALTLYGGRPAYAVRAVLRRGWLDPDIGILTRAFVIPGVVASLLMIAVPPIAARIVLERVLDIEEGMTREMRVLTFRLAYPFMAVFWIGLLMTRNMLRVFEGWQVRIRDEAYLMGERLHNFGGTASKVSGWKDKLGVVTHV
ncbi:uncharacterized protein GGS22DRAFT_33339 [Annulohypoxylon maeteangense]|uniref:uncharacterized protein n=1 Tax=Annulohypoxylon maeteangense TaxID=1927788 RepID=UPI0020073040|nr:uncharacterized protein GGS22DRAFT_33339 [Annulohypoxylon maeteangense]KAI0883581.1 hypothetical protein GGS22DRAFT_33339 [Annulohypoxylon maeteangense]